jgi:hypothetical protein
MAQLGVAVFDRERLSGVTDSDGCGCSRRRTTFGTAQCNITAGGATGATGAGADNGATSGGSNADAGATITTKPIVLGKECRLRVSACIAVGGGITAHLLAVDSDTVLATSLSVGEGRAGTKTTRLQDAVQVLEDGHLLQVRWKDAEAVGAVQGKKVRLRLQLKSAVVYGFQCEGR